MFSAKNARFHEEIKRWNTSQLIEALNSNGLSDCCEAIQSREIDGDTFLNLTEYQLAFWRSSLTTVQIKRLWSYVQLARENPQNFVSNFPQTTNLNIQKAEKVKSPIAKSLERVLELQNINPLSPPTRSEGNYPINVPPRPAVLPPKPSTVGKRLPPTPGEEENILMVSRRIPPVPPQEIDQIPRPSLPVSSIYPLSESPSDSDFEEATYEEEPIIPVSVPNSSTLYKKPPNYENSPVYQIPPNPRPVRRDVPPPSIVNRPLPSPPREKSPIRLSPSLRNNPEDTLRRPVFLPPPNIPNFHESDDEDPPEYDVVDEIPQYKSQPWFKDIDRKLATTLLKGRPNGSFIARPSTKPENECTFSVVYENRIYNLPVEKKNDKVVLGKNIFETVNEIVERFLQTPMVLSGPNNTDVFVTLRRL